MKPKTRPIAAFDIGGTNLRAALVDARGRISFSTRRPTDGKTGRAEVLQRIVEMIDECREQSPGGIRAVSIGFPGPLEVERGYIHTPPNLPAFRNTPLKAILEKRTGLPVFVDNDANLIALGEQRFGAGVGVASLVCFTLGTGIGGGIVLDGKVWHGANDVAGEIGHMIVVRNGRRCGCGARGCLEQYASATGAVLNARALLRKNKESLILKLADGKTKNITSQIIYQAAKRGDAVAAAALEETARYLAIGVSNIINILNPQMIVVTGGLANAGARLMRPLWAAVKKTAVPAAYAACKIVRGKLGDDSGILGAGAVAFASIG